MKINKYPDGSSYVNYTKLTDKIFRVNSYEDLWHLNQFVDAFISEHSRTPNVLIPNLIDAQADRRFNKGESSGLHLVLEFLNSMKAKFSVFHPHNAEVVEAALSGVNIIDNSDFVKEVLWSLNGNFEASDVYINLNKENLILMSSDAGGFKPLMKTADKINWQGETESASKSRQYLDGKSKLVQKIDRQDFGGKDILIVDDICVRGGTFVGLAKMLRERNAGKLYLAVSHMTLEELNPDLMEAFDKVFTTNSKGYTYYVTREAGGVKYGEVPKNLIMFNLFN